MFKHKYSYSISGKNKFTGLYLLLKATLLVTGIFWGAKANAQNTSIGNAPDSIPAGMDFIKLKNGDRLLGKIIKIVRGDLYFDGDKTGDVKIDLKDIKNLKGQKKMYRIDIYNKGQLTGKIDIAPTDGFFLLVGATGTQTLLLTDIVSLKAFETGFMQRIDGNLNFGYSYTKSSGITRFNMNDEIVYSSEKWQVIQAFSGIYTIGDNDGMERIEARLEGLRLLKNRWKALTELQYQRMLELGLKARIIGIGGVGKRIVQSRHVEFDAGTGFSVQKEYSINGTAGRLGAEIPLLLTFHLFDLKKPDIDISSNSVLFYNLTVAGRVRIDHKINFSYEVVKDFLIGFQFFYNYDSKPVTTGSSTADFGTVFTLGYKF